MDQIHILLALVIMGAYLSIPFTALRRLPMPRRTRVFGSLFFITCAITHLALAMGFHDSQWMILSDLVQAVASIGFIYSVSQIVEYALRRAEKRLQRTEPPVVKGDDA